MTITKHDARTMWFVLHELGKKGILDDAEYDLMERLRRFIISN
jgi:hypothetical protein